jgi:hypothetical protein
MVNKMLQLSRRAYRLGAAPFMVLGVWLIMAAVSLAPVSTAAQQPASTPTGGPAATPTPLSLEQLTAMQPGLSTYMMETAQRMGIMWLAAQQNNWDFAAFEAREAREVLQHGAVRQNASRQQGINSFNSSFMDPLVQVAQSGDKTAFENSYTAAIQGCNSCHGAQNYGQINRPFSFVKLQVPKTSPEEVYAYGP